MRTSPPRRELASLPDPGAIIFDLDGTLVDTVDVRIQAWLQAFAEIGVPADRDHVAGLIGSDGKRLAKEVAAAAGNEMDDERAEAIDRRSGELYDLLNTNPAPLPGATELLEALAASDAPSAIATSSRAEQVVASVAVLRLNPGPLIVDGGHVAHAKPAPDLLLLAAKRLSVPAPACWYVGDATWDMLAARSAPMVAVGVPTGAVDAGALREAGADAAVDSLWELSAELSRRGVIRG